MMRAATLLGGTGRVGPPGLGATQIRVSGRRAAFEPPGGRTRSLGSLRCIRVARPQLTSASRGPAKAGGPGAHALRVRARQGLGCTAIAAVDAAWILQVAAMAAAAARVVASESLGPRALAGPTWPRHRPVRLARPGRNPSHIPQKGNPAAAVRGTGRVSTPVASANRVAIKSTYYIYFYYTLKHY
jgi:hypothetical protein